VSLRIAELCKPHSIEENLILPAARGKLKAAIGSQSAKIENYSIIEQDNAQED
jgi:hypothetical protein